MIVGRRCAVPNHQEKLLEADGNGANSVLHARPEPKKREADTSLNFKNEQQNVAGLAMPIWKTLARLVCV